MVIAALATHADSGLAGGRTALRSTHTDSFLHRILEAVPYNQGLACNNNGVPDKKHSYRSATRRPMQQLLDARFRSRSANRRRNRQLRSRDCPLWSFETPLSEMGWVSFKSASEQVIIKTSDNASISSRKRDWDLPQGQVFLYFLNGMLD